MPQITTFAQAQDALRPLYENARTLYNLDVMRTLMAFLGNPQNKLRIIHIAGTSGKTSTAYYAAALLHEQGLHVGLTVSPHVDNINERLQINGQPLPEAEYCALFGEFLDVIADSGVKPSYFEALTALSYWELARRGVDYAVIEVGMGGEMDATNVIDRRDKVCVITDIGYDHTEILGKTLDKIAWYKAGIISTGNQVFMYKQGSDVNEVIQAAADHHDAVLTMLPAGAELQLTGLPPFQQRNLGLAVQAVNFVNQRDGRPPLTPDLITAASKTLVPARLEIRKVGDKTVILDGSHNQQKMAALVQGVQTLFPNQDIAVLASFVAGNEERWQGAINELLPAVKHIVFTSFHSEKDYPKSSADPATFHSYATEQSSVSTEVLANPSEAFSALLQRPEPMLLVTGSFYLMNHIRPLLKELT